MCETLVGGYMLLDSTSGLLSKLPEHCFVVFNVAYDGCFGEPCVSYIDGDKYNCITHNLDRAQYQMRSCIGSDNCDARCFMLNELSKLRKYAEEVYIKWQFVAFLKSMQTKLHPSKTLKFPTSFFEIPCAVCKDSMNVDDMIGINVRYYGGIVYTASDFVCYDCYSYGSCEECCEYYGKEHLKYHEMTSSNLCEWCYADREEKDDKNDKE